MDYSVTLNGKVFELEKEVHDLLLATSKERDTLRANYISLEHDYDVVNDRALDVALRFAEVDEEFAKEFQDDEFWSIVAEQVRRRSEGSGYQKN